MRLLLLLAVTFTTPPAMAQEPPLILPTGALLDLASQPFLDNAQFEDALRAVLPSAEIAQDTFNPPLIDPFLWVLNGTFGADGTVPAPGAILRCARYGLATREWFAEHGFTGLESFLLMRQVRPLSDDPEVWPEGAVARLHCSFVWDDARSVAIVPEAEARGALSIFETVSDPILADTASLLYGPEGYRVDGIGGPSDSVVQLNDARMVLTQGHQSFTFRSFLMGGGS